MTQPETAEAARLRRTIRNSLILFIAGLTLSGLTAFPLTAEIDLLTRLAGISGAPEGSRGLCRWLATVRQGVDETAARYPFLFYGTDWLAFGHLIIALFFFGPLNDPIRNVFVLRAGILACALVWPLAFICGAIRGIPFAWQLIDCSFGVIGLVPLLVCLRAVRRLEALQRAEARGNT